MKKIIAALLLILLFQVQAHAEILPQGTMVVIQAKSEIDADNVKLGQNVKFRVINPIKINNKILIKSNTEVLAEVTTKSNNFILGKPGKLGLDNFRIVTLDNKIIPLNGQILDEGENRYWANIGWFFLFPILFIKGNDGKIPANVSHTMYILEDIDL